MKNLSEEFATRTQLNEVARDVNDLKIKIAVNESDIKEIKGDITEMKDSIKEIKKEQRQGFESIASKQDSNKMLIIMALVGIVSEMGMFIFSIMK